MLSDGLRGLFAAASGQWGGSNLHFCSRTAVRTLRMVMKLLCPDFCTGDNRPTCISTAGRTGNTPRQFCVF
jgi:hypothetical protein